MTCSDSDLAGSFWLFGGAYTVGVRVEAGRPRRRLLQSSRQVMMAARIWVRAAGAPRGGLVSVDFLGIADTVSQWSRYRV